MPKSKKKTAHRLLTGGKLLARVKSLGSVSKNEMARACGYITFYNDGTERIQMHEFLNALVEAKGIQLDSHPHGKRGRNLTYRASVQKNGTIIIGAGYTKEMNLHPGDRFDITLGRTKIKLTAIDTEHLDAHEFVDFAHEDEEFDDDEIN